jgi:hypothetical protein
MACCVLKSTVALVDLLLRRRTELVDNAGSCQYLVNEMTELRRCSLKSRSAGFFENVQGTSKDSDLSWDIWRKLKKHNVFSAIYYTWTAPENLRN